MTFHSYAISILTFLKKTTKKKQKTSRLLSATILTGTSVVRITGFIGADSKLKPELHLIKKKKKKNDVNNNDQHFSPKLVFTDVQLADYLISNSFASLVM